MTELSTSTSNFAVAHTTVPPGTPDWIVLEGHVRHPDRALVERRLRRILPVVAVAQTPQKTELGLDLWPFSAEGTLPQAAKLFGAARASNALFIERTSVSIADQPQAEDALAACATAVFKARRPWPKAGLMILKVAGSMVTNTEACVILADLRQEHPELPDPDHFDLHKAVGILGFLWNARLSPTRLQTVEALWLESTVAQRITWLELRPWARSVLEAAVG